MQLPLGVGALVPQQMFAIVFHFLEKKFKNGSHVTAIPGDSTSKGRATDAAALICSLDSGSSSTSDSYTAQV